MQIPENQEKTFTAESLKLKTARGVVMVGFFICIWRNVERKSYNTIGNQKNKSTLAHFKNSLVSDMKSLLEKNIEYVGK